MLRTRCAALRCLATCQSTACMRVCVWKDGFVRPRPPHHTTHTHTLRPTRAPLPPPPRGHPALQEVVTNLMIASVEFRSEADPEVAPYVHGKSVEGARQGRGCVGVGGGAWERE